MDKPPNSFISRNLVTLVMVPAIIAIHFGWNAMQNNRSLVQEDEKIDLPVVTFAKYLWKKLDQTEDSTSPKVLATKTANP